MEANPLYKFKTVIRYVHEIWTWNWDKGEALSIDFQK